MSKPREWWDAELEMIILEHYRKSCREWWARQCIDNECHAPPADLNPGADFSAELTPSEISHKLPTNAGGLSGRRFCRWYGSGAVAYW